MTTTTFPERPRREDPHGHMVVMRNLEFLRDDYDHKAALFNQGADTIAVGNTSVTVNHTLGTALYYVSVTPTQDPTTRYWVSNKTTTSFRINLAAAAPVGGIAFDWIAKGV